MQQILCNTKGALLARMPQPEIEHGCVLVKTHYSLISVGTEIAPLRPSEDSLAQQTKNYTALAKRYISLSIKHPDKAVKRVLSIVKNKTASILPAKPPAPASGLSLSQIKWRKCKAKEFDVKEDKFEITADNSQGAYQVISEEITIVAGSTPIFEIQGEVLEGSLNIGVLSENRGQWLLSQNLPTGAFHEKLVVENSSSKITFAIANCGTENPSKIVVSSFSLKFHSGSYQNELTHQGWNVGYSLAGEVIAIGVGVNDIAPGELVTCSGAGQANHAEYVCVKRNLVSKVPKGCSNKLAATATVGSIALQGVRRANVSLGETVCVLGLGLIGQITMQLLRAGGARVIGMDLQLSRVKRAKELGMEIGCTSSQELMQSIKEETFGYGVDCTLITAATKSNVLINQAMQATRRKGSVVIVGDVGLNIERAQFYRKEIDLLMSTSYGPGRYDRSYEVENRDYPFSYVRWTLNRNIQSYLQLIADNRIDIQALIDEVVPLQKAPEIYQKLAKSKEELPIGVLIEYPCEKDQKETTQITIQGHKKAPTGPLHFGLIGIGAFGTSMLLPQMQKRKDAFFLRAIVSSDTTRGGNFARANQVEIFSTKLEDILTNPEISLVVIATRHSSHATKTLESLKANKNVFVEKPLALNWEDLDKIVETYNNLEAPPLLMVGFNRRFSPALQAVKEALKKRRSPLAIQYRLNGGYIPLDSWIQDDQGGGRNLGEACHMYDVFRFLTESPVTSIQAQAINPGQLPYAKNDNFSATLGYQDGSIANLLYTALGPKKGLAKERIEIFCDAECYIVDDFVKATKASEDKILWQGSVDKGHFEELSRFADAIIGNGPAPLGFDEIIETTAVSLHIEDLLHGRNLDE